MPSSHSEGILAFMPTSNDSLSSNFVDGDYYKSQTQINGVKSPQNAIPRTYALNDYGSRNSRNNTFSSDFNFDNSQDDETSPLVSPQTLSETPPTLQDNEGTGTNTPTQETMAAWNQARDHGSPFGNASQPSTASSQIPKDVLLMGYSAEGAARHWYDRFMTARQAHQHEAESWKYEKALYEAQIGYWRDAYHQAARRADSGVSGISAASKENDKVFNDPETVKAAQEGLRKISVTSGVGPTSGIPSRVQSLVEDPTRRPSASVPYTTAPTPTDETRLPSIDEAATTKKDIGRQGTEGRPLSIGETGEIPIMHISDVESEVPYSPPTSAAVLSPPPPSYRLHAGHTPRAAPRDRACLGDADQPSETVADSVAATMVGTLHDGQEDQGSRDDNSQAIVSADSGDYELRSPKILPTNPTDEKGADTLSQLNERLGAIAADPKANPPEALRHMSSTTTSSTRSDPNEHGPASGYSKTSAHDETGGVTLRTKKSLNFGTQLGQLH